MSSIKYASFFTLMQKITASPLGAWLYAHTLHHLDKLVLHMLGGRITWTSLVAGLPVVMVTTTGVKSGRPRTTPLLCMRDESDPPPSPSSHRIGENSVIQLGTSISRPTRGRRVSWLVRSVSIEYMAHEARAEEY